MEKIKINKTFSVILIIILVIILLFGGVYFYTKNPKGNTNNNNNTNNTNTVVDNKKDETKNNENEIKKVNDKISYKQVESIITFYSEGIELKNYQCEKSDCGPGGGTYDGYTEEIDNNIVIIYDGTIDDENRKIVFFDVNNGVLKTYTGYSKASSLYNSKYIHLMSSDNKKQLIVDYMGNVVKEGKNYKISCYEGCYIKKDSYNIEKDYIITVKDDKYGIEKISDDEVLLDNLYDDISWSDWAVFFDNDKTDNDGEKYYIEKNYVKIKENNKWYLYNLNDKTLVIDTGYEELILVNDNTILVYDNKEIYFIDYKGNKIDENIIKTNGISSAFAKPTFKEKFNMYLKDNVLDFKICDGEVEFWSDCYSKNLIKEYKYDLKNKKIELVK